VENDIDKLKVKFDALYAEVHLLHQKINKEKQYRLEDKIRFSHFEGELDRRMSHMDFVIIITLVALMVHGLGHILTAWGM
jgi:hypothetical protein